MLFESVVLSIIIGYIRRGQLRRFEHISIKLWYLISIAFLIQTFAIRMPNLNDIIFFLLHILSYVIIMYVCFINRELISITLLGIGNLLNLIVIGLNSGQMPVRVPSYITDPVFDRGHALMTKFTNLRLLGDIFLLEVPFFRVRVFSIGDVFLIVGAFWLIQYGMTYRPSNNES